MIEVKSLELRKVDIATRMPFRYGIATLTAVPYLVVSGDFEIDGRTERGVAADILPPKWFTKQPDAQIDDEITEMLRVIGGGMPIRPEIGACGDAFHWWLELYHRQMGDAALEGLPPLLKGFGASLPERAAIDATCRRQETTFHDALRRDLLGIRLGEVHTELAGATPQQLLPAKPSMRISVRHTVGLADPLRDADVVDADRLDDGLPQSLETCIRSYGIEYLKIKAPADIDAARDRLIGIAELLLQNNQTPRFTLDGNEFYTNLEEFRSFWEEIDGDPRLGPFLQEGLLVVEQPLHRDAALSAATGEAMRAWPHRPPIIIDESDGEIESLPRALAAGYVGTSHKNCKGVFKGLANACLINHRNQSTPGQPYVCTGEDLMNLGPIALLQDLAVGAAMGLEHMERNGHHYVAGLGQMPPGAQRGIQASHGDLYRLREINGEPIPALAIDQGSVSLDSVNRAPFGYGFDLDVDEFELIDAG